MRVLALLFSHLSLYISFFIRRKNFDLWIIKAIHAARNDLLEYRIACERKIRSSLRDLACCWIYDDPSYVQYIRSKARIDAIGDRVAYGLCNSFTRICNAGAPAVTCSKSSPHTDRYRCRFYWFYEHPSTNFVTGIVLICDWLDGAVSVTGYLRSLSNPCELLLWIRLFKGPQHFVPSDDVSRVDFQQVFPFPRCFSRKK